METETTTARPWGLPWWATILLPLVTTAVGAYADLTFNHGLGLPFQRQVYDGNWVLLSKAQFWYDWTGSDMFVDTPAAATQHDRTNYGPSLIVGRGNLSDSVRFDVNDPNDSHR